LDMKKFMHIGWIVVLICLLGSCEFDELKEPANVSLKINMVGQEIDGDNDKKNFNAGKLRIRGGSFVITEIEMDGKRADAEDYYFSHIFEQTLIADFSDNKLNQKVNFNFPQGIYDRLKIILHVNKTDTTDGIVLRGKYSMPGLGEKNIEFCFFNQHEVLEIYAEPASGKSQISLKKGKNKTLEIQLNVKQIFRYLNPKALQNANVTDTEEGEKIIISEQHNTEIFYNLISRIEKSTRAVIK
ncbi:MAG: hypothetical protein ACOCZ4_02225, partial [Bacteroidota bacterium]